MKNILAYLLIGLVLISMCIASRGKRGGRIRRINVILSERDNVKSKVLTDLDRSNLPRVPLNDNSEQINRIEVNISDINKVQNRPHKPTLRNNQANNIPVKTQRQSKNINLSVLNVQSACNKVDSISNYIEENKSDIVFLCETWINENNDFTCDQFTPRDHTTHHVPRIGKRGGGVGIITRKSLRAQPITDKPFQSFEHATVRLKTQVTHLTLIVVYRPPGYMNEQFITEFSTVLETHSLKKDRIIICGDFNIHLDKITDDATIKFTSLLREFGLVQHTSSPTHRSGHILDLVITRVDDDYMFNEPKPCELFSDHFDLKFQYKLSTSPEDRTTISFRKLKELDIDKFKKEISLLNNVDYTKHDTDSLLNVYNVTMRNALDIVAPLRQKRIKVQTLKPWIDEEVIRERTLRRSLERKMLKDKNIESTARYKLQKNRVNFITDQKKIAFFNTSIENCNGDQKLIYQLIKKLSNKPATPVYPEAPNDGVLSNQFSEFFKSKIEKINEQFSDTSILDHNLSQNIKNTRVCQYEVFPKITTEELRKYIAKSPTKSCALDPIPTFLLKECLDIALPVLTEIVNKSLSTGYMPKSLKQAIVTPIPKKPKVTEFKNFRPISNLPFLSKVIERIVIDKLSSYCKENELNEPYQSAYRKNHSCETALLEVTNCILTNMDNQKVTLLTLLDLSAAFDTVPHDQFLSRLESDYGITSTALQWFSSYFKDRFQTVNVNNSQSSPQPLTTGMPQGSGTGPWGYTKYTGPLGVLIRILCLLYHMFADDTQLHTSLDPKSSASQSLAKTKIENCISTISSWMTVNRLKLNSDKTEFIVLGTKQQLAKMQFDSLTICGEQISSSTKIRNLGVYMDREMKMNEHVQHVVRVCYGKLREISSFRKYITTQVAQTLVQSAVISHIDYANSLLYGINEYLLDKLQRAQNAAARLILGLKKYDNISAGLIKLHWLPIRHRIKFKIATITFKVLSTNEPIYLRTLLEIRVPTGTRRSKEGVLLRIPKSH